MRLSWVLLALVLVPSCGSASPSPAPVVPTPAVADAVVVEPIRIERIPGPVTEERGRGDGRVTIVRFDLRVHRLALVPAPGTPEAWRPLPDVARERGFVAGINAGMFEEDGRASGLFVIDGVERAADDPRFGGILAFDPIDARDPPVVLAGRDCPGVDLTSLRTRYRSLVANYRLLDCDGAPIAWVDESRYSSAAFGLDRDGRFVLVHAETPYLMRDLARTLADPALGLRHLHYVEGGPKATLFVDDGSGTPLVLAGSREDEPALGPRPIPNILGIARR